MFPKLCPTLQIETSYIKEKRHAPFKPLYSLANVPPGPGTFNFTGALIGDRGLVCRHHVLDVDESFLALTSVHFQAL